MTNLAFRQEFVLGPRSDITSDSPDLPLTREPHSVWVRGSKRDDPIKGQKSLALVGSGYSSEEEAANQAAGARDALIVTFARLGVGAAVGSGNRGGVSNYVQKGVLKATGHPVVNATDDVLIFDAGTPPLITRGNNATLTMGIQPDRIRLVFKEALARRVSLSERERVAYDLWAASFFESNERARFLSLVIAVEALLTLEARPPKALQCVNDFVEQTKSATRLTEKEKKSLLGSLSNLRQESIRSAARRFVGERLGDREFMGTAASDFFITCYDVRSQIVHEGQPKDPTIRIGSLAANMEVLVGRVLASSVSDVDL